MSKTNKVNNQMNATERKKKTPRGGDKEHNAPPILVSETASRRIEPRSVHHGATTFLTRLLSLSCLYITFLMTRAIENAQAVTWLCRHRRYFRFLLLGALSTCAIFNVALHSATGLSYYCEQECFEKLMALPLSSLDRYVIEYIQDNYVDPPHPMGSYKHNFPLENPPWTKLGKWHEGHKFIMDYFGEYEAQNKGVFVEVGAQDGEFMSFTLWMEQVKGFEGLLIEPNPIDYPKLRAKKRSSSSINACAAILPSHRKHKLWIRDIPENLPTLLKRDQEGRNRLVQYVTSEDRVLGKDYPVQCFNLGAMIKAALHTYVIDFLSISTHGGELDILDTLPASVQIRMLLIVVHLATYSEFQDLKLAASEKGLVEVFKEENIHIFIPKAEVVFRTIKMVKTE